MKKSYASHALVALVLLFLSSCSSLFGGGAKPKEGKEGAGAATTSVTPAATAPSASSVGGQAPGSPGDGAEINPVKDKQIRFSDNPNIGVFNSKKYRHMSRKQIEDESEVHAQAGSLWNNEGQVAYLFAQNSVRRDGELVKVKLEGNSRSQIESKVDVIKKLLARIEILNSKPVAQPPGSNPDLGSGGLAANGGPGTQPGANNLAPGTKEAQATRKPAGQDSGSGANNANGNPNASGPDFNVDIVPTRITERMPDGNYRVKGTQSFMIGKREFKVIVMGLVRPEDINDEGVSANKLIDPQLDVVSLRRSMTQ